MKRKFTLEEHKEFGELLNHPTIMKLRCLPITYGKRKLKLGSLSTKLDNLVMALKSDLEACAYEDGFRDIATDIYYTRHLLESDK